MNSGEDEWTPVGEERERTRAADRLIEIASEYILKYIQDDVTEDQFALVCASDHNELIQIEREIEEDPEILIPRMADFTLWAEAAARAHSVKSEEEA